MAQTTTTRPATVECSKCSGSGQYLHFGTCYRCAGTGRTAPTRQPKPTAWWARQCICLDASMQDMLCHMHDYATCIASRNQLANDLKADAAYQASRRRVA